jgi:hypothetical protein
MSKTSRIKILQMLSDNLAVFFPELKGCFRCPVCLTDIPLDEKNRISEAHIIPKAAQGKLKTYLCAKCNSTFGKQQDKWFGEWVRLANQETPTVLATNIRDKYFELDGVKIHGEWKIDSNKNLCFYIHKDRNSPEVNKLVEKKFMNHPHQITVNVPLPVLRHQRMIEIGFLTAGYLLWFGVLGYSWVLQHHLDSIREQILNPEKNVLGVRFIAYCKHIKWQPWVGLMNIANETALVAGLENFLFVFPSIHQPEIYSSLGNDFSGLSGSNIRPLRFSQPFYGPAVCVTVNDRMLVAPDMIMQRDIPTILIHFDTKYSEPQILYPLGESETDQHIKNPEAIIRNINMTK